MMIDAAVSRITTALSAILHESADISALLRLASLTPCEHGVIIGIGARALTLAVFDEITKRRAEGCWPHKAAKHKATA